MRTLIAAAIALVATSSMALAAAPECPAGETFGYGEEGDVLVFGDDFSAMNWALVVHSRTRGTHRFNVTTGNAGINGGSGDLTFVAHLPDNRATVENEEIYFDLHWTDKDWLVFGGKTFYPGCYPVSPTLPIVEEVPAWQQKRINRCLLLGDNWSPHPSGSQLCVNGYAVDVPRMRDWIEDVATSGPAQ